MKVVRNYLAWLRNYLEDLDVEGKILLKMYSRGICLVAECVVREVWGGGVAVNMGGGAGTFWLCKMQEISWLDEGLLHC